MTLKEYLTKLFGDDKPSMTLEELAKAAEGNAEAKFVDLKEGGYVDEGKFKGLETQLSTANDTIKQLQETVKKFDGKDPEKLSADLAALQKKYDADTAKLRLDNALDVAIIGAKGRSTKAVKAFLDLDKLKLKEDGTIEGLNLEALKKSEPYLFESVETNITGGGEPGDGDELPAGEEPPKDYAGYKKWREKHQ
jgi:hypothetical protein|nr:MAG TPA: minor structural protein [Bacteriophage sp.]